MQQFFVTYCNLAYFAKKVQRCSTPVIQSPELAKSAFDYTTGLDTCPGIMLPFIIHHTMNGNGYYEQWKMYITAF